MSDSVIHSCLCADRSCSFGAVLEDFEVRDAVAKVIANKGDYPGMEQMEMDWHSPPNPDSFR